jgi:hypothetical protein
MELRHVRYFRAVAESHRRERRHEHQCERRNRHLGSPVRFGTAKGKSGTAKSLAYAPRGACFSWCTRSAPAMSG